MLRFPSLFRKKEFVPSDEQGPLFRAVNDALWELREYAQSHGGRIDLVGVSEDGVVKLRMSGACKNCPLSGITLKLGVEERLRVLVPGVKRVIQAND